nr:integrase, catalytic region, zinc finger, CCHC-type, peptidase aspartic, catalytic [Tanacetum cinerariifolium]
MFTQGDDPIDAINKMMSFISSVVTSCFLSTNNELRNPSNLRQQATIHDGRVTVQPLKGRQNSYASGTSGTRANTSGGNYSGQQRTVKCFNCQGEDFGKHFVPQQKLSAKQAFHLQMSNHSNDSSNASPVIMDVPSELPKNNTSVNQTKPSFDQMFELNNLKAEFQAKDITIMKLKENIKRLNKTSTTNSVKKDIDEIETINIELEHRVAKLIAKNKHLKQTYKQLYDSIKPSRVRAKE